VTYRVVRASASDLAAILAMQRRVMPEDEPVSDADWWIVASDDGPVGFGGMVPSRQFSDVGYLVRAGVLPAHRGRGLQKRLIRARLAAARRAGYAAVVTDTYKNPTSANSLISCGFRAYEPARPWAWADSCYWIRTL